MDPAGNSGTIGGAVPKHDGLVWGLNFWTCATTGMLRGRRSFAISKIRFSGVLVFYFQDLSSLFWLP